MNNYRPISILSKLLETVVYRQLYYHLNSNNLLSVKQSGFRPNYSTQDVLIYITDKWNRAIDRTQFVGAVFLDLRKAFDCVDHEILLSKLSAYLSTCDSISWFRNYLCDRYQMVRKIPLNGRLLMLVYLRGLFGTTSVLCFYQ